jgi:hypothetical protein
MLQTGFDPTQTATDSVPPGLDEMLPGPVLGAYLSGIDVAQVSGYDRIVVLRAHQRMALHYQAHTYSDTAAITTVLADNGEAGNIELASAEIRVALHLTRRAPDSELAFALDLKQRLPQVHAMLASGLIDVQRAKVIDNETCHRTKRGGTDHGPCPGPSPQDGYGHASRNSVSKQMLTRQRNGINKPSTHAD